MAAILVQFALDNVHRELTQAKLWHHLETQGLRPRDWTKDHVVLQAIDVANALYQEGLRQHTIGGQVLPRAEAYRFQRRHPTASMAHPPTRGVLTESPSPPMGLPRPGHRPYTKCCSPAPRRCSIEIIPGRRPLRA